VPRRLCPVTEIGKADCIPRTLRVGLLSIHKALDVMRRGAHHRLDHESGLWHADRNGGLADGRDCNTDADREHVLIFRILLMPVGKDEAARISQSFDVAHCGHDMIRGQIESDRCSDLLQEMLASSLDPGEATGAGI
jgi:hypothetical protein